MHSREKQSRWAFHIWWFGIMFVVMTHPLPAMAHGGGRIQIANAPLCGDLVSVWLNPASPKVNEQLHVTVGIADVNDASPVLDRKVSVEIVENGRLIHTAAATTEQSVNRLFYEADLPALPAGSYVVRVQVQCAQADEAATFMMEVTPSSLLVQLLPYITAVLLIPLALLVWKRSQTGKAQVNRPVRP